MDRTWPLQAAGQSGPEEVVGSQQELSSALQTVQGVL